jgi:CheY-like chemotaxis protein
MKKILVIEDEEPVRENLLELLEAEGFNSLGAEDGQSGLETARQERPDLILCDIMMPRLNGYGVLAALRQEPQTATIPFIFLSAKADYTDQRQGMQLGADDYLTKPFSRADVLEAISARLAKQAAITRQSDKRLDDLRSSIAHALPHEFLTPLHVIMMSSEMLMEDHTMMSQDQIGKMSQRIHSTSLRLHQLIQNFLMYTELQLTASDPERIKALRTSSMSPTKIIIAEIVMRLARQKDRTADLKMDLTDAAIQMSDERLRKLVEELVDNAFKYSAAGTPVLVSSHLENGKFVLRIQDKGRGMSSEQIAHLGAYMQVERKLHEQQGSGLGFTIARQLIELHGGQLKIESQLRQGTLITAYLPA